MNYPQIFFLLSISFQLSGALTLIIFCWGNTEKRVLRLVYPVNTIITRGDDNMVKVNKEKLREAHKEVLLNRIAFISLGLGYFLSVFSTTNGVNPYWGVLIVVVVSCLWTGKGVFIAHIIAVVCNKEDRKYSYEELTSIIDKDIATNITNSEIDEICQ